MNYPSDTLAFNKAEILKVLKVIDEDFDLGDISNDMLPDESIEFLNIHNPFNDFRRFLFNTHLLSLWESACIACEIDSAVLNQFSEDELRDKYPEWNSALTMLNAGIKSGLLQYHDYEILKLDLQKFLFEQGIYIIGFNKNIDDDSTSNSLENENQELRTELTNLKVKLKENESNNSQFGSTSIGFASVEHYQKQRDKLLIENESLKKQLELVKSLEFQNAINEDIKNINNSDLLLISVLMGELQTAISVRANKSQAKILQKIEDANNGIKGLSKSRTEKIIAEANKLYKSLKPKQMK